MVGKYRIWGCYHPERQVGETLRRTAHCDAVMDWLSDFYSKEAIKEIETISGPEKFLLEMSKNSVKFPLTPALQEAADNIKKVVE